MNKERKKVSSASENTFLRLYRFIRKSWFLLAASILLAGIYAVTQLLVPWLFGRAIDGITEKGAVRFSFVFGILMQVLVVTLVSAMAGFLLNLVNNRMTFRVVQRIRSEAMEHILYLPLSWLDRKSTGDIVSRIISDADILSDGLLLGFTQLFSGVVTLALTFGFMLSKSVKITLMVLLLTPLSFLAAAWISGKSFQLFKNQSEARGKQGAFIEEMIGQAKVVKAFGYHERASKEFSILNEKLRLWSEKATFISSLTNPVTRFVNGVIYAMVAFLGCRFILKGSLTVGGLTVLLAYAGQFMKPFTDISDVVTELQNARSSANRLFELMDEEKEEDTGKLIPEKVTGQVSIDHLSFRYVEDKPLIDNFSLEVPPGTRVALVGPTGSGKTTFINLLMRFYDPDAGSISIDGMDIRAMPRAALRRNFGMVLQETWLMKATVRENLTIGRPDATDDEIIRAAKEAHSYEFIRRLPQGLDTVLTRDSLSQGEQQLLCITRVMLLLPPILILDEATSSIDTRTELKIQEAFEKMMKGRTSFVVAHRLSTIRNADIILVMKDGHILETGSHESLMKKDGFYRKLYDAQFSSGKSEEGREA